MAWYKIQYNEKTGHGEHQCKTTTGKWGVRALHFAVGLMLPFVGALWDASLTRSPAKGFLTVERIHRFSAIGSFVVFLILAVTMPVLAFKYSISTLITNLHLSFLMNVTYPAVPLMLLTIWLPSLLMRMLIATSMSCRLASPSSSQMGASTHQSQLNNSHAPLVRSQSRLAPKKLSKGRIALGFCWQSIVGLHLDKYITVPSQRRRASLTSTPARGATPMPLSAADIKAATGGRGDHKRRRSSLPGQQSVALADLTPTPAAAFQAAGSPAPTLALSVPADRYAAPPAAPPVPTVPVAGDASQGAADTGAGISPPAFSGSP